MCNVSYVHNTGTCSLFSVRNHTREIEKYMKSVCILNDEMAKDLQSYLLQII
jgi:hypothetical protein